MKRRFPPPLHKKYQHRAKLTHKHFIYDLVVDTNVQKQKKIDLVLLETVNNIGEKGERVSVPYVRAYEALILPKLAVYATPENLEKYIIEDTTEKKKVSSFSSQFVERTISVLSQTYLKISMSMHVPWTIEKWHIKVSFRNLGIIVPEDAITLPDKTISGPDLSIENKEFYVTVKINNREEVKVRCRLLHYTSNPDEEIKYEAPFYMLPSKAIFPEDQPILNILPKHRLLLAQSENVTE